MKNFLEKDTPLIFKLGALNGNVTSVVTRERSLWAGTVPSWQVTWAYQRQPRPWHPHHSWKCPVRHGFSGDRGHYPLNPAIHHGMMLILSTNTESARHGAILEVSEGCRSGHLLNSHWSYSRPPSGSAFLSSFSPLRQLLAILPFLPLLPESTVLPSPPHPQPSPDLPSSLVLISLHPFSHIPVRSARLDTAKHRASFPPVSKLAGHREATRGSVSGFWAIPD